MKKYKYLTLRDRRKLAHLYSKGKRIQDIADALDVNPNTIYNEIKRGFTGELDHNQRRGYDPELGQKKAMEGLRRRGPNFAAKAVADYAERAARRDC